MLLSDAVATTPRRASDCQIFYNDDVRYIGPVASWLRFLGESPNNASHFAKSCEGVVFVNGHSILTRECATTTSHTSFHAVDEVGALHIALSTWRIQSRTNNPWNTQVAKALLPGHTQPTLLQECDLLFSCASVGSVPSLLTHQLRSFDQTDFVCFDSTAYLKAESLFRCCGIHSNNTQRKVLAELDIQPKYFNEQSTPPAFTDLRGGHGVHKVVDCNQAKLIICHPTALPNFLLPELQRAVKQTLNKMDMYLPMQEACDKLCNVLQALRSKHHSHVNTAKTTEILSEFCFRLGGFMDERLQHYRSQIVYYREDKARWSELVRSYTDTEYHTRFCDPALLSLARGLSRAHEPCAPSKPITGKTTKKEVIQLAKLNDLDKMDRTQARQLRLTTTIVDAMLQLCSSRPIVTPRGELLSDSFMIAGEQISQIAHNLGTGTRSLKMNSIVRANPNLPKPSATRTTDLILGTDNTGKYKTLNARSSVSKDGQGKRTRVATYMFTSQRYMSHSAVLNVGW